MKYSILHLSYSSEPVMRRDYQILLKSPPITLLAGSVPELALDKLVKFGTKSLWSTQKYDILLKICGSCLLFRFAFGEI